MKTTLLTLFFGLWWLPFYVSAAGDGPIPTTGVEAAENRPADMPAETATAGRVTRALFTSEVKDHEPVDNISTLSNDKTRVYYFTEIHGMAGQTVIHRWEYKGKVLMEMPFKIGASRWRVYSMKTLDPSWLGEWKASVVDASGSSLSVTTFTYLKKPDAGTAPVSSIPAAKH
ncbi:MAG: DUF2914 domain-containing protein [Sulfuricaulis sp.]